MTIVRSGTPYKSYPLDATIFAHLVSIMEILGYCAAILIGISLGMLGGGGSILTVPVLVYLMHINPLLATTSSLFIVGITSLVGAIKAYSKKQVDFKVIVEFGIPSIFSIFITRHHILPALPENLFSIGGFIISKEIFLMLVFALLMFVASLSILLDHKSENENDRIGKHRNNRALPLVIMGLIIGVITGLLGAGGGFLIIPFLVMYLKVPMKTAVGTSLLIIALNSLFGFLFSLKQFQYNWSLLIVFTALAILGIVTGSRLAEDISSRVLKKAFGWFILLIGIYIIIKELFFT